MFLFIFFCMISFLSLECAEPANQQENLIKRGLYALAACAGCCIGTGSIIVAPCLTGPVCACAGAHAYCAFTGKGYGDVAPENIPPLAAKKVLTQPFVAYVKGHAVEYCGITPVACVAGCTGCCIGARAAHELVTHQPKRQ